MRIIDLLNKISKGEKVPEKIEYDTKKYYFRNYTYKEILYPDGYVDEQSSIMERIDFYKLNDEVEVIEDNDDLELLPEDELQQIEGLDKKKHNIALDWNFRVLKDKINELVKEINEIRRDK